jgi:hypothetical protein
VIPIEETKRIDWNAIRAEYIGGGISQRKLAKKYGIAEGTMLQRANVEGWKALRNQAEIKSITNTQQKTADAAADNAVLAADIKKRLLLRLSRAEQKFPMDATEVRTQAGKSTAIFKLRDLTAAYKDLTEDMAATSADNALLQSLLDLERRAAR